VQFISPATDSMSTRHQRAVLVRKGSVCADNGKMYADNVEEVRRLVTHVSTLFEVCVSVRCVSVHVTATET